MPQGPIYATDLGYVPVVLSDACGAVDEEAGRRAMVVLEHADEAMFTDAAAISRFLRKGARAPVEGTLRRPPGSDGPAPAES